MGVLGQVGKLEPAQNSLKLRYGMPKISKNVLSKSINQVKIGNRSSSPKKSALGCDSLPPTYYHPSSTPGSL